ncbi:hypothetical protein [Solirubrobacter soli]|uniref:hypothetical protein n=1 Tax=Solirubrobacter soli TaxID=363832 RepID=UPI000421196B|nr:hypothetical protein [Solirubrobacter soli]
MTTDCLFRAAGRLVTARDPAHGAEIVATAREGATDVRATAAELAALVGYALRARRARTVWLEGAGVAALLVVLAALTPFALVVPFALLVLGLRDARAAAAATLFWLWRLVTADVAQLAAALDSTATLRWALMLAVVAVAAHVTRASIRRAAAL